MKFNPEKIKEAMKIDDSLRDTKIFNIIMR